MNNNVQKEKVAILSRTMAFLYEKFKHHIQINSGIFVYLSNMLKRQLSHDKFKLFKLGNPHVTYEYVKHYNHVEIQLGTCICCTHSLVNRQALCALYCKRYFK